MDNDSADEGFGDLIYWLEKVRYNPLLPKEELTRLEQAREIFVRYLREEPVIAQYAFVYGVCIGAHIGALDAVPEAARRLDKARQSIAGTASAEKRRNKPWRKHAKELATKIRDEHPSWSQDRVASEIEAKWRLRLQCPTHPTLKNFVSDLEKAGELPQRVGKRKSRVSLIGSKDCGG